MGPRERLIIKPNKMGPEDRMKCHRCGSIMFQEKYYSPEEQFWGWRCIYCGDIVDQIILKNRGAMAAVAQQL